ncbi:MAG: AbrB/MazE/SpoVT family DNA-binding domain-containing protein [Pseudomonadota bacterium]|uniref:AbrB/MazE/SpoVT family DNA-binding domain-containing protein n=1 Tax=Sphingobium sp. TaxID=1912891 RepID=UPI002E1C8227
MQVRIDKRGRLTLPKNLRDQLGMKAGDQFEWIVRGMALQMRPVDGADRGKGEKADSQ